MSKINVLVTGATGFVGSNILDALMAHDEINPIAACRNESKITPAFTGEVRTGDLTDKKYVHQLVQGVDVVCHAAAWTSLWSHTEDEIKNYREPTKLLIDAAIASGVKRFIFDSSVTVTGVHRNGNQVDDSEPAQRNKVWPHMNIVADIENYMKQQSVHGTAMIAMRFGHFVGARYNKGLLSLLFPRLKTHMVPWVDHGKARVPFIAGHDIGHATYLTVSKEGLAGFLSFNVCGLSFPTMKEVIEFLKEETGVSKPHFNVPLKGAYAFGWLMEKINPIVVGDPFLTRGIVFLGEDWHAPNNFATTALGFQPRIDWKEAVREQLDDMEKRKFKKVSLTDLLK